MSNAHRTSRTQQFAPRLPLAIVAEVRAYAAGRVDSGRHGIPMTRAIVELLWHGLRTVGMAKDVPPP